ncbi:MAG: protein kinase [Candidatus Latescibacterota bacterium]|jgi:serine/threonine-protein kinase
MLGKKIAHYQITERIGAGGMGEVFKAHDTRLGRDVALKFLPESFAADAERLQRFEREAKLLAALNHPNIAAIYGIEQTDDARFLVLELVPGEDLAQRIGRGAVPVDDALEMALQVTEALEAAHDQGVVHRDLKPGNIVVTPDGTVKVLDFGLAKALESDRDNSGLSHSPTLLASSPTVQGVILGTAGYMSPEQARGKTVDRRADIWAFGCVLTEMLTGRQTFTGETVSDTLASVLKTEPELESLPGETPPGIVRLLGRCLDKDPRQRLRDIGEARIIIEKTIRGGLDETIVSTQGDARPAPASRRSRFAWLAAAVVVAAAAGTTAWTLKPEPPPSPLRKFSLAVQRDEKGGPDDPVISPDGTRVAYTVGGRLWVQELDELKPREISVEGQADMPFWSPDGDYIGYLAAGKLWKIPIAGGASVKVCDPQPSFTGGRGATWGRDGRIIYSYGSSGLWEVTDQGGDPHIYHDIDKEKYGDFHEPFLLPGGKGVLYVAHRANGSPDTIELLAGGEQKQLVQVEGQRLWNPQYSPSGHILYRRSGVNAGVWALPFSLSKLEATGEPFLVAADGVDPSVSGDGTLVYLRGENDAAYTMRWVDRNGVLGDSIAVPGREYGEQTLSPDGTKLAVTESDGDEVDVWIHDLTRGTRTRFTFDEGVQAQPTWSPDGTLIYYNDFGRDSIVVRAADGTGAAKALVKGRAPHVSGDGRYLAYHVQGGSSQEDIWYLELGQEGAKPKMFLNTPAREGMVNLSPDGRFIAYQSNESGNYEIYVKRFPGGEGKWQASIEGGSYPSWRSDGSALYYVQGGCDIIEVPVESSDNLVLGTPRKLIDCSDLLLASLRFRSYAVSRDGSRFLMLQAIRPDLNTIDIGITVVQNWAREFSAESR